MIAVASREEEEERYKVRGHLSVIADLHHCKLTSLQTYVIVDLRHC